jgi:hypothetical protein
MHCNITTLFSRSCGRQITRRIETGAGKVFNVDGIADEVTDAELSPKIRVSGGSGGGVRQATRFMVCIVSITETRSHA